MTDTVSGSSRRVIACACNAAEGKLPLPDVQNAQVAVQLREIWIWLSVLCHAQLE